MATLLLRAAGTFVGGLIGGPFGAILGAGGALAGYAIDQSIFGQSINTQHGQLDDMPMLSAQEGSPIARAYGTVRGGGQLIWATRFQEEQKTENVGGGKGFGSSATVTNYTYKGNFAIGLCEGEISSIRRIWADGQELDISDVEMRLYKGSATQTVDPLIANIQGADKAPAYRGLAYVVFEGLPLGQFGNRIPQFTFEIIRTVGNLENDLRAITIIPGASEFAYEPAALTEQVAEGEVKSLNRHVFHAGSDWEASLDELQALCPNLERVALVVSWFGDDLRCDDCSIAPRVEVPQRGEVESIWTVSGLSRQNARLVSQVDGSAALGGTPSDLSVIHAIQDLKSRGIKVTLYPFVMMDIPADNALPNPYGNGTQAAYPWRGRITSPDDKTPEISSQIDSFLGQLQRHEFTVLQENYPFSVASKSAEFSYRRLILHYAHIAAFSGGVDAFVIGSELRGLTSLRDENDQFPFVQGLIDIAADCRSILGSQTDITYAADWTEYFGHQPADGTGDIFFNLDPLWADQNIDAIGIDNYMPLADWRGGLASARIDGFHNPYDKSALKAQINGGEGYDWYFASEADRKNRIRTATTSEDQGENWLHRFKDLSGWWSNQHFDRRSGTAASASSPWVPQSKPIWFTELGAPATDKASNQPNVFPDPKSSENEIPYFSTGGRDDLAQRRFLEAHLDHWHEIGGPENPISTVYGGPMVPVDQIYLWSWDARPFPAFPQQNNIWSDGGNWQQGHWLTGRLGTAPSDGLINAVLQDYGLTALNVANVTGTCDGLLLSSPVAPRTVLEALVKIWGLVARQREGGLIFETPSMLVEPEPIRADMLVDQNGKHISINRMDRAEMPNELVFGFKDSWNDFAPSVVSSFKLDEVGRDRSTQTGLAISMSEGEAQNRADNMLQEQWAARTSVSFALSPEFMHLMPGDLVQLESHDLKGDWLVSEVHTGDVQKIEARSIDREWQSTSNNHAIHPKIAKLPVQSVEPVFELLDLPILPNSAEAVPVYAAVSATPWVGQYAFYASPNEDGYSPRGVVELNGVLGRLESTLPPSVTGRWSRAEKLVVKLLRGALESVDDFALFSGANALAVQSNLNGAWEVLQFSQANLVGERTYELSKLLRGQLGTEVEMLTGANIGTRCVLLNSALQPLNMKQGEQGVPLNWRAIRAGALLAASNNTPKVNVGGQRALMPLRPVHLKMQRANSVLHFSWIRQTRIDGDSWQQVEVPLGEAAEAYQVSLIDPISQVSMLDETISTPSVTISVPDELGQIELSVSQLSETIGAGPASSKIFQL